MNPNHEEYNCLTCHVVGLNPITKKELIEELNKRIFNPVDLDDINNQIIDDKEMTTMFKQYSKFKDSKNDKFKELDKKMSSHWENKFLEICEYKILNSIINTKYGYLIDCIIESALYFLINYDTKLIFHEAGILTKKYIGQQEVKLIYYLINQKLNNIQK